ncbi:MAG: hypothetical protein WCP09_02360 [Candidatus Taylorbacteria bacterium]
MALTKEKLGEIALKILQAQLERNGLPINHPDIKREVDKEARDLGITSAEFAELAKLTYKSAYEKLVIELDKIIADSIANDY